MSLLLDNLPLTLVPGRLYMFLVGPGIGESVILRLPDESWCVIDCWQQDKHLRLGQAGATLKNLYDRVAIGNVQGIHLESGTTLFEDSTRDFRLHCLTPHNHCLKAFFEQANWHELYLNNANQLSSVLRLDWKEFSLILGGDLPKTGKYGGWHQVSGPISNHFALKIPHHGSFGSVSDVWAAPNQVFPKRVWMLTAYKTSNLPRFQDGEGLDAILRFEERILLSSRPAHISQRSVSRTIVNGTSNNVANPNPGLFSNVTVPMPSSTPEKCLVGACFDSSGACLETYCLSGGVEILR